jgi:hypothetical protein
MGLADHEERELADIAQHLASDDPRFAGTLGRRSRVGGRFSRTTLLVIGLLTSYVLGLVVIIAGVTASSIPLIVLGALLTASGPVTYAALLCRAHLARRGTPRPPTP